MILSLLDVANRLTENFSMDEILIFLSISVSCKTYKDFGEPPSVTYLIDFFSKDKKLMKFQ